MSWHQVGGIESQKYNCGFCGNLVATRTGFCDQNHSQFRMIAICPHCDNPTFFDKRHRSQIPGTRPGKEVSHVPPQLYSLYCEARDCCRVNAFTASVLASRKLLMNIAVQQGATAGLKFVEYVDYLDTKGFIPPNGKGWVDLIRKKGNEATHEIPAMTDQDANDLISFLEMLLKFIFEFPARVPKI